MYVVACATCNVYAQEGFRQEGAKRPHGGQETNTPCGQSLSGEFIGEREGKEETWGGSHRTGQRQRRSAQDRTDRDTCLLLQHNV